MWCPPTTVTPRKLHASGLAHRGGPSTYAFTRHSGFPARPPSSIQGDAHVLNETIWSLASLAGMSCYSRSVINGAVDLRPECKRSTTEGRK